MSGCQGPLLALVYLVGEALDKLARPWFDRCMAFARNLGTTGVMAFWLLMACAGPTPGTKVEAQAAKPGEVTMRCEVPARVSRFSPFWITLHFENTTSAQVGVELSLGGAIEVHLDGQWRDQMAANRTGLLGDLRPDPHASSGGAPTGIGVPANGIAHLSFEYRDPFGLAIPGRFRLRWGGWKIDRETLSPAPIRTSMVTDWVEYEVVADPDAEALAAGLSAKDAMWTAYCRLLRCPIDWGTASLEQGAVTRRVIDRLESEGGTQAKFTLLAATGVPLSVRLRARLLACRIRAERSVDVPVVERPAAFAAIAAELEAILDAAGGMSEGFRAQTWLALYLCYEKAEDQSQLQRLKAALARERARSLLQHTSEWHRIFPATVKPSRVPGRASLPG